MLKEIIHNSEKLYCLLFVLIVSRHLNPKLITLGHSLNNSCKPSCCNVHRESEKKVRGHRQIGEKYKTFSSWIKQKPLITDIESNNEKLVESAFSGSKGKRTQLLKDVKGL